MLRRRLTMGESAVYRIRFQGAFDDSWEEHLGPGWNVEFDDCAPATTTIVGPMRDQAALLGLLSSLYDVGLPLLEVEYLATDAGQVG